MSSNKDKYLELYKEASDSTKFEILTILYRSDDFITQEELQKKLDGKNITNELKSLHRVGLVSKQNYFGSVSSKPLYNLSIIGEKITDPMMRIMESEKQGIEEGYKSP